MRRHAEPAGVTLVELLVVVAIIGAMAGLLLPAVQASRAAARRATCQSHMRQWALAVQDYADTHRSDLPRRGQRVNPTEQFDRPKDWFNALPPYLDSTPLHDQMVSGAAAQLGGVWKCPSLPTVDYPRYFAYGMNMWLSTWKSADPDNLKSIGPTSTMVFMADGIGVHCSLLPSNETYSPDPRHEGTVNLAFMDGHVTAVSGDELGCGVGLRENDTVRWIVPDRAWGGPED